MKKRIVLTGIISLLLVFGMVLAGCGDPDGGPTGGGGTDTSGTGGSGTGGTDTDGTGGSGTGGTGTSGTGSSGSGGTGTSGTGGSGTGGTAPSSPTGVNATTQSSSSISVSWSPVSGATSYKVYYEIGSSSTKNLAGAATSTNYTHTGLDASTTYYYYIKAVNNAGESGYSAYSSNAGATTSSGGGGSGGTDGGGGSGNTTEYTIDQAIFNTNTTKKNGSDLVFNWTLKTSGKTPNGLYTYKAPDSIVVSIQSEGVYIDATTLAGSARSYTLKNYANYVEDDRVYLRVKCVSTYGDKISYVVYRPSVNIFTPNYP
jgi:hypothetical protein